MRMMTLLSEDRGPFGQPLNLSRLLIRHDRIAGVLDVEEHCGARLRGIT